MVKTDEFGREAVGFAEDVDIAKFLTLQRVLFVVAWMADGISLLPTFKNDFAVVVLVLLLTVDNAVADERAVNFGKRDFEIDYCHDDMSFESLCCVGFIV